MYYNTIFVFLSRADRILYRAYFEKDYCLLTVLSIVPLKKKHSALTLFHFIFFVLSRSMQRNHKTKLLKRQVLNLCLFLIFSSDLEQSIRCAWLKKAQLLYSEISCNSDQKLALKAPLVKLLVCQGDS